MKKLEIEIDGETGKALAACAEAGIDPKALVKEAFRRCAAEKDLSRRRQVFFGEGWVANKGS